MGSEYLKLWYGRELAAATAGRGRFRAGKRRHNGTSWCHVIVFGDPFLTWADDDLLGTATENAPASSSACTAMHGLSTASCRSFFYQQEQSRVQMHFAVPFGFSRVFQVRLLICTNMAPFICHEDTRAFYIRFLKTSSIVNTSSHAVRTYLSL